MKKIVLLVSLISVALIFALSRSDEKSSFQNLILTASCSDSRIKTINQSISQCQLLGISLSSQCIKNYLFNHTNQQLWDVMVELPDKCSAKASVWFYNDCSFRYENYGQFKMNYNIWKATPSANIQSNDLEQAKAQLKIQMVQPNDDCSQIRVNAAKSAVSYCQSVDMSIEVSCIRNNLQSKLGQKWDVVASESTKSAYSIKYEFFDGCAVKLDSFGARQRNYLVWKAE